MFLCYLFLFQESLEKISRTHFKIFLSPSGPTICKHSAQLGSGGTDLNRIESKKISHMQIRKSFKSGLKRFQCTPMPLRSILGARLPRSTRQSKPRGMAMVLWSLETPHTRPERCFSPKHHGIRQLLSIRNPLWMDGVPLQQGTVAAIRDKATLTFGSLSGDVFV